MLHRFFCWCGWHTWVTILIGHRICVYCGKRQQRQFSVDCSAKEWASSWIDDNE